MTDPVLFFTSSRNHYLYSARSKRFLLLHPLLAFYIDLNRRGTMPLQWFEESKSDLLEIENVGTFSRKDREYYLNKYLFLLEHGYLDQVDFSKQLTANLTGKDVERWFAQTPQVTFEVTEACNLRCKYCCFGEMYQKGIGRGKQKILQSTAIRFLDYFIRSRSQLDESLKTNSMTFSFYGGEPLLNMPLVTSIIEYAKIHFGSLKQMTFGMTTNGILLSKHLDELMKNDFSLTISLDGNEKNHSYRVFPDGSSSHAIVHENALRVKQKYPHYFDKKVKFISTLHNRNSFVEINTYFEKYFSKKPSVFALSSSGIRESNREEFDRMFKNSVADYLQSEGNQDLNVTQSQGNPIVYALVHTVFINGSVFFLSYPDLLEPEDTEYTPGGTCMPFSRKIFITVDGKILPCERISQEYSLGRVTGRDVQLDFSAIALKYNERFSKLRQICSECYRRHDCTKCVFDMHLDEQLAKCKSFATYESYARELAFLFSKLEMNPNLFHDICRNFVIL